MPFPPMSKMIMPSKPSSTTKKVLFNDKETARSTIRKYRETGDAGIYINAFQNLKTSESVEEKLAWFSQMTECVSLLDRKADKIVIEFLKIPWYQSPEISPAMDSFISTLVTAHNYYAYLVLKQLFYFLIPEIPDEEDDSLRFAPCAFSVEDEAAYKRILNAIVAVHSLVPLCRENLLLLARKCIPYFRRHVHQHAVYTYNLLLLSSRLPHLRLPLLEVIISNMVTIDVNAPRADLMFDESDDELDDEASDVEDMFEMEVDDMREEPMKEVLNFTKDPSLATRHKEGNTLDVLMTIMLQYVHDVCHGIKEPRIPKQIGRDRLVSVSCDVGEEANGCHIGKAQENDSEERTIGCECEGSQHNLEALKLLYLDLREVFSHIILCTQASSHVQFLMFYLISIRPGLVTSFLEFLRMKKFEDPNHSRDTRRNAMAYMGSLLARGKCIPFSHIHSCLEIICSWCHAYLENQERVHVTNYEDLSLHYPFYYACQTVFYVFTFRFKEYTETPKKLELARILNMERLVHSPLNPLKICAAPVVSNFAAVTRRFQLAYCYTIMENNKRMGIPATHIDSTKLTGPSTIELFFPFDPYLLQRSKQYISGHYKEFDGLPEDEAEAKESKMDQDDDGLDTIISPKSSEDSRSNQFSYGSSPGFKSW